MPQKSSMLDKKLKNYQEKMIFDKIQIFNSSSSSDSSSNSNKFHKFFVEEKKTDKDI